MSLTGLLAGAQPAAPGAIRIRGLEGRVELMPSGASTWVLTQASQELHSGDKLRTGAHSRVALLWYDQSVVSLAALTEIEVLPPPRPDALPGLHVVTGLLSFFHRDQPGRIQVLTRGANASVEGTEFVVEVAPAEAGERTSLSVIDGRVQLGNSLGTVLLTNRQQAVVEPGRAPARTAGFLANNLLQWCFYYPAVLDPHDLDLTDGEQQACGESLAAYRAGDLLGALAAYPRLHEPASAAERLYLAALALAVGQVQETEDRLAELERGGAAERFQRLADALRTVIAAVKRQSHPSSRAPRLATEWLAASYYEQARATGEESLQRALAMARAAAKLSPAFGFAGSRVAELEFGFGHTARALDALDRSLALSPRNAQALALKGFVLAAQDRTLEALRWFEQSITADPALGNAWLGHGLCRIRRGEAAGGRADLLVAAAAEPQRALLRSYLGKAYTDAGDELRAERELRLALRLDPADPTGWLYLALLEQRRNQINEAVNDLETSQKRNDNRSLFRSRLLLDEDRAVGSANLASVYRDAGMDDVSVREAARAVTYDYANASAHLFLADSYNDLRDPTRFNLRYETVWFNELLLANLLSPVGGGRLSQHVSQQEYSRLFEADRFGVASSTLGRTDGQFEQLFSQFGINGRTAYSLDVDYQHNDGVRSNNELDRLEWYSTLKHQFTPQDSALVLVKYEDYHSGDNFQYYDPKSARATYHFDEYQQPILTAGWHHEWSPGMHTLIFCGRLVNEQSVSDAAAPQLLLIQNGAGALYAADSAPLRVDYHQRLEIYTSELSQLFQWNRVTLNLGMRHQIGAIDSQSRLGDPPAGIAPLFSDPAANTTAGDDLERWTGYGYLTVRPMERLWLTGGLAYDDLTYPLDFRYPPVAPGQDHRSRLGPKAAVIWSPLDLATLRGVFTRSLGGVSLDESYRLEPAQLAGFPQSFRSLISESVVGSVEAPKDQTYGVALDLKFPTRTYVGLQAERLDSDIRRTIGLFSLERGLAPFAPDHAWETLHFRDRMVGASVHQLLGRAFTVGASYDYARAELQDALPAVPISALASAQRSLRSELHHLDASILWNGRSGWFGRWETHWYGQVNSGYAPALPGDSFFQYDLYGGYRFAQRRAQITLGLLNLAGQDYRLNPLTVYQELPRKRVLTARLDFQF